MSSFKGRLNEAMARQLRQRAEAMLEDYDVPAAEESLSKQELLRELQLQRIELTLHNEELEQQRQQAEKALEKYRSLYLQAPLGYLTLSLDGTVRQANYRAAELLGVVRAELEDSKLQDHITEKTRQALEDHLQDAGAGTGLQTCRLAIELSGGTEVFIKMRSVVIDDIHTGTTQCRSALIDICDEHKTEQKKFALERQLRESHRMETLGRLASGIAHDFNNLLTLIIGYSKLAMNQVEPGSQVQRHAGEINKAGRHAAELIDQLLAFTRSDTTASSSIDVNAVIRDMETMFDRLLGDDIELNIRLRDDLAKIQFDPSQFQQVLMNLVVNAREAITGGGHLIIRSRNGVVDDEQAAKFEIAPGDYVLVEVEDNGNGIAPEVIPHIFEPFFTTKSKGQNHGIGLSTTYGIVKKHGGIIHVESTREEGSKFQIYLPTTDSESTTEPPLPTVLVVDDQPDLREFASLVLEELDVEVLSARSPEEALQISRACGDDLDLLVTDVTMPGMSGPELLARIRQSHASMRVLYMSGHDRTNLFASRGIQPEDPFLDKPFSPEKLAEMVEHLLFG